MSTEKEELGDIRGVEEVGSSSALVALVGVPAFNATTGAMTVPLGASDKLLIVSQRSIDKAILLNGRIVTDPTGVMAVATGAAGSPVKSLVVTVGADTSTVVLDYLNGIFATGVTGTFTSTAPIAQGTTVDFAAYSACAFKIRATSGVDTVYFGKDKTAKFNKLVSFNTGSFPDVWVKTSGAPATPLTYGISLGDGNDVFNGSPGATVLGGFLTPFTDPIVIHGGMGDDAITGGKGADTIYGDEGNNLIDESAYVDGITVTASTTRTLKFDNVAKTISAAGSAPGSFVVDGFVAGGTIIVTGTTKNNGTYTLAAAGGAPSALVLTTVEALVADTTVYATAATVFQINTTHLKDTVYGLAASGVTTVTYAARPYARANAGVVVKIGHDAQATPVFLAGTEDNLDESVAVVIGSDFPDTMACSDVNDVPCTLVGGKGNDTLTAGFSTASTHKLYGGDGADTLAVTDKTDKALLMGGNWTDSARPVALTFSAAATSTLTFNSAAKTITNLGAGAVAFDTFGFAAGQTIQVAGTTGNGTTATPKTFTLATVTATVLTVNEAMTADVTVYATVATKVALPIVAAPKNLFMDTVDFGALTGSAVAIDLNFPFPVSAKGYIPGLLNKSGAALKNINVTQDIGKARCPQVDPTQVCTFTGNNSGNYVVAGKGADVLTGGTGDDSFDLSAFDATVLGPNLKQVAGGGGSDSVDFSSRTIDNVIDLSCTLSTCKTSGANQRDPGIAVVASATRTLTFNSAGKTITAGGTAPGSFVLNGFVAGQSIVVSGALAGNNVTFTIASVSATVLTVVEAVTVDATVYSAGATITRAAADLGKVINAAGADGSLTFNIGKTITASVGGFIADGFKAGQSFVVAGTTANNGTFTIASLTATVLTVNEALVTEGTYSTLATTITRAPAAKVLEGISLVGITNATCPASAGLLICTMTGSPAANILDFNGCIGTVICGGGADIIVNPGAGVDTHCGL